uniref:DUF148 domain-containing protein n=1 Tax=Steinernema glaseri TaxID=37863 RepID=A0A1I7YE80_9BILA
MTPSFFHWVLLFTSVSIAMSQYYWYDQPIPMDGSRNEQPQPQVIVAPPPDYTNPVFPSVLQGIPNEVQPAQPVPNIVYG